MQRFEYYDQHVFQMSEEERYDYLNEIEVAAWKHPGSEEEWHRLMDSLQSRMLDMVNEDKALGAVLCAQFCYDLGCSYSKELSEKRAETFNTSVIYCNMALDMGCPEAKCFLARIQLFAPDDYPMAKNPEAAYDTLEALLAESPEGKFIVRTSFYDIVRYAGGTFHEKRWWNMLETVCEKYKNSIDSLYLGRAYGDMAVGYLDGNFGLEKNPEKAANYFKIAMEYGNAVAKGYMARAYAADLEIPGVSVDFAKGMTMLEEIMEEDHRFILYYVKAGREYIGGYQTEKYNYSEEIARKFMEKLKELTEKYAEVNPCPQYYSEAEYAWGWYLECCVSKGGVGLQHVLRAAKRGNVNAIFCIANNLKEHWDSTQNYLRSIGYMYDESDGNIRVLSGEEQMKMGPVPTVMPIPISSATLSAALAKLPKKGQGQSGAGNGQTTATQSTGTSRAAGTQNVGVQATATPPTAPANTQTTVNDEKAKGQGPVAYFNSIKQKYNFDLLKSPIRFAPLVAVLLCLFVPALGDMGPSIAMLVGSVVLVAAYTYLKTKDIKASVFTMFVYVFYVIWSVIKWIFTRLIPALFKGPAGIFDLLPFSKK